ncbi:hypothetical protein KKI95_19445 [Xenorhabdus bovienii]|uniref:hypothetical protein n=1 Tax=Xenorhabdus bovienii TaxID=40576 RepID=UPI0023B2ED45|nr:hypothetical protein [Xenorhabdus bovienii]MDE9438015.1 hypothetical protein [Xenorhabdus bovienii]MDE9499829.1 hypothetical protein [Xenorhabdus bovienii]
MKAYLEINPENKQDTESNGVTIDTIKAGTLLYKTTAIEDFLNNAKDLGITEYNKRHQDIQNDPNSTLTISSQWAGQYFAFEEKPDEYKNQAPYSYDDLLKNAGRDPLEKGSKLDVFSYTFKVTKDIKVLKPDSHSDAYYEDESKMGWEKADTIRKSVQTQSKRNIGSFSELRNLDKDNFLLEELGKKGYAWMGPLKKEKKYSYELGISPELLSDNLSLVLQDSIGTYKLHEDGVWKEMLS